MKEGSTVTLRNAKIDMYRGSMRLAVDKWGRVEVAEPASFTVKEDKNLSLIEYELVNVVVDWICDFHCLLMRIKQSEQGNLLLSMDICSCSWKLHFRKRDLGNWLYQDASYCCSCVDGSFCLNQWNRLIVFKQNKGLPSRSCLVVLLSIYFWILCIFSFICLRSYLSEYMYGRRNWIDGVDISWESLVGLEE